MIITKDMLDTKVPVDMFPTRLDSALNLYSYIEDKGLVLYNVNPTTWNCLYPFFELNHKFTIETVNLKKVDMTFRELIEEYQNKYKEIHELQNGFTKERRKDILTEEYIKTFNLEKASTSVELTPCYELKYSKSKNVWTLYYFENYIVKEVNNIENLLNQKIYQQSFMPLDSKIKGIDGVEVVSNLPYILSIKANVELLKQNAIKS